MTMLDGRGMVRLVGEVAGGAIALLGVGWAVAGLVYLANRQVFTRSILAWIAIFVAAILTYFVYLGRSL